MQPSNDERSDDLAERLLNPIVGTAGYGTSLIISAARTAMRQRRMVCHGRSDSVLLSVKRITVWL